MPLDGPIFDGAIAAYAAAFAEPPYSDDDRGAEVSQRLVDLHSRRPGYRAFVAIEGARVVGMIYGYHGMRGQWWHDMVEARLSRADAIDWLGDSYELVEVAVLPSCQGKGVGSALIDRLLAGCTEATCVLSTRTDSMAHHLYRRLGFVELVAMRFAPAGAPFYIMGKRLPPPSS